MPRLKIDGQCHCGAIRYEAEVDPAQTIICHCTDCQTMSGAPYRVNAPAATRALRVEGEPTRYVKIGGSGEPVVTTFCGVCGTPLWSGKGEAQPYVWLRTGAIAQRAELVPRRQGFCDAAMAWASDISGIPAAGA